MLQLTPLEETRAGKELIAIGEKRGKKRGEERGEIIGSIRMCQRFLGIPISTSAELAGKSLRQLEAQRKQLLAQVDRLGLGNA